MLQKIKTKKSIALILLLSLVFSISYADDQLDVKTDINNMRNAVQVPGILGDIFTKIFDTNGKIKEVFLSITGTATTGYLPMWDSGLKLINSPLFYLAGKIGIGTTIPSEALSILGGLSITQDPNSGDDVGDRDYNDNRYQEDIAAVSCAYGIASINDIGTVVCATNNDTNTQLSEAQVDSYVSNNGYLSTGFSGDEIQDGTIDSTEIEDNTITANDLAADSVGSSELANNSVANGNIVDGAVTSIKISNDTITETDISDSFTARDSDKLDGYNSSKESTINTVVVRDSVGDINARLFRSEFDTTSSTIGYIMTQIDTISNNYLRPSTPAQFRAAVTDGSYLGISAKATDSDLLDGNDSTYFQKRVSGTCAVGSSIRAIAADGTVTCETDDVGSMTCSCGTCWTTSGGLTCEMFDCGTKLFKLCTPSGWITVNNIYCSC